MAYQAGRFGDALTLYEAAAAAHTAASRTQDLPVCRPESACAWAS
jgi:hypothetical protein